MRCRTGREHAEDVAAETCLVAWRRLDAIPPDAGTTEQLTLNPPR